MQLTNCFIMIYCIFTLMGRSARRPEGCAGEGRRAEERIVPSVLRSWELFLHRSVDTCLLFEQQNAVIAHRLLRCRPRSTIPFRSPVPENRPLVSLCLITIDIYGILPVALVVKNTRTVTRGRVSRPMR